MKDFEIFFKNNSAIILLIDAVNGNIADANPAALKFYGYSYKKMLSLNIEDFNILPKKEIKKQISKINKNEISNVVYKHKIADNSIRDIQSFVSPVQMNGRKFNLGIIQDVTQLKITEEESNRFKKIAENATSFISITNTKKEIFYLNSTMRKAFSIPENADLKKYNEFDFYTNKGKKNLKKAFAEIAEHGFWKGENEMQSLDGQIYQVLQTIVLIKDNEGKPQYTSFTAIDITEQKLLEFSLKNSEEKLKQAELLGRFGYFEYNLDTQIFEFSAGAAVIYGLECNRVPGDVIQKMRLSEYNNVMEKATKDLIKKNNFTDVEYKIKRQTDNKIVGIHVITKYDSTKRIIFGSVQEITERMNAEVALKRSEEKFKHLITEMTVGVVVHGSGGEIILHNPMALELLGLSKQQLFGKTPFSQKWNMIHEDGSKFTGDTHPATEAFVKKTVIKEVVIGVYRPLKKDRVWLLVTAIPEFKTDKTVLQVIVTFYDITEKRKKEEQVQKLNNELKELTTHLQRMRKEEKNKFALEVHDKLGQKLVGVKLEIDLLKNYLKEGVPEITQKIAPISEKIEEMLKDFSEIYTDVNSTFIDDFEIYDTIDSLINSYRKYDQFKFIFSSNMQNERLPHEIKWVIYKTVKECLDNILLHSKATIASVKLFKKKGMLSLIIHDNGYEANISKPDLKKGISLIEMRERVHSIRGIIDIESLPEKGTTVKVSVPKIV